MRPDTRKSGLWGLWVQDTVQQLWQHLSLANNQGNLDYAYAASPPPRAKAMQLDGHARCLEPFMAIIRRSHPFLRISITLRLIPLPCAITSKLLAEGPSFSSVLPVRPGVLQSACNEVCWQDVGWLGGFWYDCKGVGRVCRAVADSTGGCVKA